MFKWLLWHKVQVTLEPWRGNFHKTVYLKYEPQVGDRIALRGLKTHRQIVSRLFQINGLSVTLDGSMYEDPTEMAQLAKEGWELPRNFIRDQEEQTTIPINYAA